MDFLTYMNDFDFQLSPISALPAPAHMDDLADCTFLNYFNEDDTIAVPSTSTSTSTVAPLEVGPIPETNKRKVEDTSFAITPEHGGFRDSRKRCRLTSEKEVQPNRSVWVRDRSQAWWYSVNHPNYPDSDFRKAFRMSRATFNFICNELSSAIAKEDTTLRSAIPVEKRVAVCIWRLATGDPLRVVSDKFGLGISTCHKLILEVCSAIRTFLLPKFLQWPDASGIQKMKSRFESGTGIPNVVGSMYTTHIPIVAPKNDVNHYFNERRTKRTQKTSYSVAIQGVVDPDGVFTDVCIGCPGGLSDEQILIEKSNLQQRMCQQPPDGTQQQWIVGGSEYPLMDWMMVPYTHQNLTWTQHAFNEKTSDLQRVAVEAFGRLKARWNCLQKRNEVKLQDLPNVLGACCVLHNVCDLMEEEIEPDLSIKIVDDHKIVAEKCVRSSPAMHVRDGLAHNLLHGGRFGSSMDNLSL